VKDKMQSLEIVKLRRRGLKKFSEEERLRH
jgi:hypothetical protein